MPTRGTAFHIGLTTRRLESALGTLSALFGVTWTRVIEDRVPGLVTADGPSDWWARRAHSVEGPLHMEVFEGSAGSTWATDRDLLVHHLAYWTDDLPAEVRRLETKGWSFELGILDGSGTPTDFAYLTHPSELRIELVDSARQASYAALLAG